MAAGGMWCDDRQTARDSRGLPVAPTQHLAASEQLGAMLGPALVRTSVQMSSSIAERRPTSRAALLDGQLALRCRAWCGAGCVGRKRARWGCAVGSLPWVRRGAFPNSTVLPSMCCVPSQLKPPLAASARGHCAEWDRIPTRIGRPKPQHAGCGRRTAQRVVSRYGRELRWHLWSTPARLDLSSSLAAWRTVMHDASPGDWRARGP